VSKKGEQKYFLCHKSVKERRTSIHVNNTTQNIQYNLLHEVHQARELIGLQNDNLAQHYRVQNNPIEQIHAKLKPQQLATSKDNLALHHIDQQSLPPSKMQELPHIYHHDLAPLSDILEFSPNYIIQEMLQDLQTQQWVPPLSSKISDFLT